MKKLKTAYNRYDTALRFCSIITVSLLVTTGCNNSTNKPADTLNTQPQSPEKSNKASIGADVKFIDDAAAIYRKEIKLGELAQKKTKNADVKALGYMMETAHTSALNDLTALAGKKHINIPDTASYELNAAYHELSEIPADKFDKAYCIKMESAHNSAIEVFERASRECIDTDIKKMAEGMLTDFDTHLYHIVACLNKLDTKVK